MKATKRITWKAYEFEYRHKSVDWFWYVGFIALIMAIGALYLGNITFTVVIIIAAGVLLLEGGRPPRLHTYIITRRGVQVGDIFLPYSDINSYTIHDDTQPSYLILDTNRALQSHVLVPLTTAPTEDIRDLLDDYLPEDSHEIPFSEQVARRISL